MKKTFSKKVNAEYEKNVGEKFSKLYVKDIEHGAQSARS